MKAHQAMDVESLLSSILVPARSSPKNYTARQLIKPFGSKASELLFGSVEGTTEGQKKAVTFLWKTSRGGGRQV